MKEDEAVAIKIIKQNSKKTHFEVLAESGLMHASSESQHITKIISCFVSEENMAIVMPFYESDVYKEIEKSKGQKLPIARVRAYTLHMCHGVAFLHANNIVHRDLKPENLLVHNGVVNVADFGIAQMLSSLRGSETSCGTPGYRAPEVGVKDKNGLVPYDGFKSEMWSIGAVVFAMASGDKDIDSIKQLQDETGKVDKDELCGLVDKLIDDDDEGDFIKKLLVVDPSKRMSLLEAFKHPVSAAVYFFFSVG